MNKLVAAILIAIFIQFTVASSSALVKNIDNNRSTTKSEQGWRICQSGTYGTVAEFTPHAIKMRIDRLKLTIITKSPKWDAIIFNDSSKTCAHLPYNDWQKKISINGTSNHKGFEEESPLFARTTGKTRIIEKHLCTEYWVLTKEDPKTHATEKKIAQIWTATDIKLPIPIAKIYYSRLGIPAQRGIPLKISACDDSGKMVSKLETVSIEQHRIPATMFDPMPGYKGVKNEIELLVGKSNEDMADMLDAPINEKSLKQLR